MQRHFIYNLYLYYVNVNNGTRQLYKWFHFKKLFFLFKIDYLKYNEFSNFIFAYFKLFFKQLFNYKYTILRAICQMYAIIYDYNIRFNWEPTTVYPIQRHYYTPVIFNIFSSATRESIDCNPRRTKKKNKNNSIKIIYLQTF